MKVSEIIKLASILVGDSDVTNAITEIENVGESGKTIDVSDSIKKKIQKYISCLNLTIDRIATSFVTLKNTEAMISDSEGKIPYSSFSKKLIEVRRVVDSSTGSEINFTALPFHLYLPYANRRVLVECKIMPQAVALVTDDIELPPIITPRILSLGVASDLLLSLNVFDESKFWNEKFESALMSALTTRHNLYVAKRKFM